LELWTNALCGRLRLKSFGWIKEGAREVFVGDLQIGWRLQ